MHVVDLLLSQTMDRACPSCRVCQSIYIDLGYPIPFFLQNTSMSYPLFRLVAISGTAVEPLPCWSDRKKRAVLKNMGKVIEPEVEEAPARGTGQSSHPYAGKQFAG